MGGMAHNAYWIDVRFRDLMNRDYKISRAQFYCPSNPGWNRDDFWKWPSSDEAVMGYFYFAGDSTLENNSALQRSATNRPIFAQKSTDVPKYPVLFADLNRKLSGSLGRPGDANPLTRGANHYNRAGDQPEGANHGFLDGHAKWVRGAEFTKFPKIVDGDVQIFFHGENY